MGNLCVVVCGLAVNHVISYFMPHYFVENVNRQLTESEVRSKHFRCKRVSKVCATSQVTSAFIKISKPLKIFCR